MYVKQLSVKDQKAIRKELTSSLQSKELEKKKLMEAIENGMDSKLDDLAELIDVRKYKKDERRMTEWLNG